MPGQRLGQQAITVRPLGIRPGNNEIRQHRTAAVGMQLVNQRGIHGTIPRPGAKLAQAVIINRDNQDVRMGLRRQGAGQGVIEPPLGSRQQAAAHQKRAEQAQQNGDGQMFKMETAQQAT